MEIKKFTILTPLLFISCRTLNYNAEQVKVLDKSPTACENLGQVYADWAWWGVPTEILNVMRNQAAVMGGNVIWMQQPYLGFAYKCPTNTSSVN